jgi:hypothetical protein
MQFIDGDTLERGTYTRTRTDKERELTKILENEIRNGSLKRIKKLGAYEIFLGLNSQWLKTLNALNYETQGKRILDLGCGANGGNEESEKYNYLYEPWFCRFIYNTRDKTGLDIVGVDIGNLSGEEFPYKQINLLGKYTLINNFENSSFDLITAFKLFNSPELEKRITGEIENNASVKASKKIKKILENQVVQILKPNGIFLWHGEGTDEEEDRHCF